MGKKCKVKLDVGTVYQKEEGGNYYFRYQVQHERKCVTVATIFSGDLKDPRAFLILIPLFALFCWSIPMTLFSSDRSLRIGTGCICYPVLIITFLVVYQEGGCEPVAWSVFAFIVLLILTGIVAGMVRKYRERKQ